MKRYIKKFIIEYSILNQPLSSKIITDIIRSQGFAVIEFSRLDFSNTESLLNQLGISEYAKTHDCFTYVCFEADLKYVFINRRITERDRIFPLIHEEGHIYQEHFSQKNGLVHDTDIRKELAANIFGFSILAINKISVKIRKFIIYAFFAFIFLCLSLYLINHFIKINPNTIAESLPAAEPVQVYWTERGNYFHLYKDCAALKIYGEEIQTGLISETKKSFCCSRCKKNKENLESLQE